MCPPTAQVDSNYLVHQWSLTWTLPVANLIAKVTGIHDSEIRLFFWESRDCGNGLPR